MMKYYDQKQLREELILAHHFPGTINSPAWQGGMVASGRCGGRAKEAMRPYFKPQIGSRDCKLEVWRGYVPSKPAPNGILPPESLLLLSPHPQTVSPREDQIFKCLSQEGMFPIQITIKGNLCLCS